MTERGSLFSNVPLGSVRYGRYGPRAFHLNLMACGREACGKTTFLNTLCHRSSEEDHDEREGLSFVEREVQIQEPGDLLISLKLIEARGFGSEIDSSQHPAKVLEYIERQLSSVLIEETRLRRKPRIEDSCVHVCLYFLEPDANGVRELDLECMGLISPRVHLIPVLAKSDLLTSAERAKCKRLVMEDLERYSVRFYDFCTDNESPEALAESERLKEMLPFAVMGSNETQDLSEGIFQARSYPWGVAAVDDPDLGEYFLLRSILLDRHLETLPARTHGEVYESFRTDKLSSGGLCAPLSTFLSIDSEDTRL